MCAKRVGLRAVILAGGSGERFWPLSTAARPKQFLRFFGGESLIRQAVSRLVGLVGPEDVFVVTGRDLVSETCRELPEVPASNVFGEPMRRDTGAAVAAGVALAGDSDDRVLAFFPADQLVTRPAAFRATLRKAVAKARASDTVVTLGIRPDRPATAFGYIDPVSGRFYEKPSAAKAKSFVRRGFLWNAGMFIARAGVFRSAIAGNAPELESLARARAAGFSPSAASRMYGALPRISFDYAVMEKLHRVEVVPADCGWDDVGGYTAFERHYPCDDAGNVAEGPCRLVDSSGCVCIARGAGISAFGVGDLVIVTTPDAVLVADKSRVGDMKALFRKG